MTMWMTYVTSEDLVRRVATKKLFLNRKKNCFQYIFTINKYKIYSKMTSVPLNYIHYTMRYNGG